jgi:protocatechuate 4,5-dioxygenase alpha chain
MGYALNKFCMSLNRPANRESLRRDPKAYLDQFALTPEQREAVETRNWLRMLELGGNIYYTYKLAAFDGMTFQQLASQQTGVTEEQYVEMMLSGGRSIENNRSRSATSAREVPRG